MVTKYGICSMTGELIEVDDDRMVDELYVSLGDYHLLCKEIGEDKFSLQELKKQIVLLEVENKNLVAEVARLRIVVSCDL